MSERFPRLNAKEVVVILKRHGFALVGQRGSHQKWRHADGRQVIVPCHGSHPIPIGTVKGSGIDEANFR